MCSTWIKRPLPGRHHFALVRAPRFWPQTPGLAVSAGLATKNLAKGAGGHCGQGLCALSSGRSWTDANHIITIILDRIFNSIITVMIWQHICEGGMDLMSSWRGLGSLGFNYQVCTCWTASSLSPGSGFKLFLKWLQPYLVVEEVFCFDEPLFERGWNWQIGPLTRPRTVMEQFRDEEPRLELEWTCCPWNRVWCCNTKLSFFPAWKLDTKGESKDAFLKGEASYHGLVLVSLLFSWGL